MQWLSKARAWIDRKFLIRSAQRKIRDGFAFGRITEAEWNALAHKPLSEAMKRIRADQEAQDAAIDEKLKRLKQQASLPKPPAM